jgi:hypothetical protein
MPVDVEAGGDQRPSSLTVTGSSSLCGVLALASSPFISDGATPEEVTVHGYGENHAR